MNISSAIVHIKKNTNAAVIEKINSISGCEVHHPEGQKLIITIEAESADKEIGAIREIERDKNVISASMVYAFSEDELDEKRDKLDRNVDNIPDWLNDENAKAEDIKYSGDIKKKL